MGRGLILFIVGMFIIMGIFNFASQNRLTSSSEDMVSQVHYTMASAAAMSGLELAGQQIVLTGFDNFNEDNNFVFSSEEGTGTVSMTRNGNDIVLVSSSSVEGVNAVITGEYELVRGGVIPDLEGALGFYNKDFSFTIKGGAFTISGCDYIPPSSEPVQGSCDDKYGIVTDSQTNINRIIAELGNNQIDNVKGKEPEDPDGVASIGLTTPPGDDGRDITHELIDELKPLANRTITDKFDIRENQNRDAIGTPPLSDGTPGNPQILVVGSGGTLDINLNTQNPGYGVIIVEDGGTLDLTGVLSFEGLIIVQGKANFTRGNLKLYGAMLYGGKKPEIVIDDNPDADSSVNLGGNVDILYSSKVLNNLDNNFSGGNNTPRLVLRSMFQ